MGEISDKVKEARDIFEEALKQRKDQSPPWGGIFFKGEYTGARISAKMRYKMPRGK